MARETWYDLEDNSTVHPSEVTPDEKGVLRHEGGVAVKMRGDVPWSRSVDVEAHLAKVEIDKGQGKGKDMKPAKEPKGGYQTRETKAQ